MNKIDKTWHLAETDEEIAFSDFELQLWRVFYGFIRWQEECERSANGTDLTASELSILHIIRLKDKPKMLSDVGRLLNRDDTHNLNYSINKLLKMRLIEKVKEMKKRSIHYRVTAFGKENTDNYKFLRKNILIDMFLNTVNLNFENMAKDLIKIKAVYDEADQAAAAYVQHNPKKSTHSK
jgi:predicted MarR family transcription regulator